ncbi:MAG: multidrug effflux MFS transporter [Sulfitobacter sp.]
MSQEPQSAARAAPIMIVLGLLSIFPPLATDMYLSAMGVMAEALQASHAAAELSLSLFFLGLCAGQFIMGPLIDAHGRKLPLLFGTALFVVTSILLTVTDDIVLFNGLRFLQALGACAGMVVGRAMVNDLYEGRQAAKMMTLLVMLLTIGPIVSPTLGSLLLEAFNWRAIFAVMVLVGIVAFVLSLLVLPETLPKERRLASPFRAGAASAKVLLGQRDFMVPVLIAGLVQGGMFAFITGSSGVFQGVFGLSAFAYGMLFAGIATSLLIFGQVNQWLLNRYDPQQILPVGLPVYVALGAAVTMLSGTQTLWVLAVPMWFAIGMVALISANAMSRAMAVTRERAGIGSALLGAVQFGIAFTVSSSVALGGTGTPLPMALGLLVPGAGALCLLLWARRAGREVHVSLADQGSGAN